MIELQNLSKNFITADGPVDALKHVSLKINDGDIYGIIGMSGAGKSTLVRCINMLERPTEGAVLVNGRDMGSMSQKELRAMRRKITMIFQGFNLLMQRTCLNNVMLPLRLGGADKKQAEEKAKELLAVGDLSVREIAARTGFSDAAFFSRTFARRVGAPPSTWRPR